jgi:hypothetical protein
MDDGEMRELKLLQGPSMQLGIQIGNTQLKQKMIGSSRFWTRRGTEEGSFIIGFITLGVLGATMMDWESPAQNHPKRLQSCRRTDRSEN